MSQCESPSNPLKLQTASDHGSIKTARLILEDGTVFKGRILGNIRRVAGEVVFHTGMTGYQEVFTDPSYAGQIVTMTYPLIGNYGVYPEDNQAVAPALSGVILKEVTRAPVWKSTLDGYLREYGVTGLVGVDTRALTRRIREEGTLGGVILPDSQDPSEEIMDTATAVEMAAQAAEPSPALLYEVTGREPERWSASGPRVVVFDLGVKRAIVRSLQKRNIEVIVVPADTEAQRILDFEPDGVLVTNGPGDPAKAVDQIETVKALIGRTSLRGICFGHQIICLALGAKTEKLSFGHRGANHPVQDLRTGRAYITSQNHGYTVTESSIPAGLRVTHRHLNDDTVEGIEHEELSLASVQFHPEAAPGPIEGSRWFDEWAAELGAAQEAST